MEIRMNNEVTKFGDDVKFFQVVVRRTSCEELLKWLGNKITQMKFSVDKYKVHVHLEKQAYFM